MSCTQQLMGLPEAVTAVLYITNGSWPGHSPSSTAGMARYRARGLSAEPPAKMMACTLLLMSSTVITPILLVVLVKPLQAMESLMCAQHLS